MDRVDCRPHMRRELTSKLPGVSGTHLMDLRKMKDRVNHGATYPPDNYMFKVNNRNTRTYSTLCPSVSTANFEQVIVGWVVVSNSTSRLRSNFNNDPFGKGLLGA